MSSFQPIPARGLLEQAQPIKDPEPATKRRAPVNVGMRNESRLSREIDDVELRRVLDGAEIARELP